VNSGSVRNILRLGVSEHASELGARAWGEYVAGVSRGSRPMKSRRERERGRLIKKNQKTTTGGRNDLKNRYVENGRPWPTQKNKKKIYANRDRPAKQGIKGPMRRIVNSRLRRKEIYPKLAKRKSQRPTEYQYKSR